ncbi:hypothetical protein [Microvirga tunisiensis]|uniref:Uncharacterized protein n=1 Tax=Microvirga tunisiensis TaxID=2108360 RepID=A0A5N7N9D8_9HYPH|nr:hypothetical protein [Microvirga tunisiensis]MPR13534.1 hypothetical protein [Microvirga tunisiensis]MPR31386.1 hypothetical protein [Microvirga tunisiensis]
MSLMKDLLERPFDQAITSKYTAMNGLIYLGVGTSVLIWPGMVQTVFRDAAFVGNEAALFRMVGMALMVIGWLFVRWPLRRQTVRRRQRIGQGGARSLGARTLGHRGSFSPFPAGVCGSRPDARSWRLAASPIGPRSISLDRRNAIALVAGIVADA